MLHEFIAKLKQSGGTCHLMGLLSPGGVHSHQAQLAALAKLVSDAGVPVAVHAFLDGRDTPPSSAQAVSWQKSRPTSPASRNVRFATVGGRYYAMDRDKRWERVELAYNAFFGDGAVPGARRDRRGRSRLCARRDRRVREADRDRRLSPA